MWYERLQKRLFNIYGIFMCVGLSYSYYLLHVLYFSYSQLNPVCFSLADTGFLMWRNSQRQQHEVFSERDTSHASLGDYMAAHKDSSRREGEENWPFWKYIRKNHLICVSSLSSSFLWAVRVDDSVTEEGCKEGEDSSQTVEQQIEMHRCTAALLLGSLNKAALHLRRAMVLYTLTWAYTHTQL